MDIEEAKKTARIARLALSEAELRKLAKDADEILEWAEQLESVKSETEKRESGALRDDLPQHFEPQTITKNFPQKSGSHLKVPRSL